MQQDKVNSADSAFILLIIESHCEDCGLCFFLCPEHQGCNCDAEEEEEENTCNVCRCSARVRYTRLGAARKWPYMTDLDDPKVSVITYK